MIKNNRLINRLKSDDTRGTASGRWITPHWRPDAASVRFSLVSEGRHTRSACGRSPTESTCLRCAHVDDDVDVDDGSGSGYPVRFAVRSLGWVEMKDDELKAEHSGKAVNRCIVGLSVGKNDVNDVVGRWGDVSIRRTLSL